MRFPKQISCDCVKASFSLRYQPSAREWCVCKCLQVALSPTRQGRFLQTHVCFYLSTEDKCVCVCVCVRERETYMDIFTYFCFKTRTFLLFSPKRPFQWPLPAEVDKRLGLSSCPPEPHCLRTAASYLGKVTAAESGSHANSSKTQHFC